MSAGFVVICLVMAAFSVGVWQGYAIRREEESADNYDLLIARIEEWRKSTDGRG